MIRQGCCASGSHLLWERSPGREDELSSPGGLSHSMMTKPQIIVTAPGTRENIYQRARRRRR